MCLKLRKGECRFWLETTIRLTVIGWATITKFSLDEIIVCQKMCVSFESGKRTKNTRDQNKQTITITGYTHTHSFFTLIEIRLNIPVTDVELYVCAHTPRWTKQMKLRDKTADDKRKNNVAVGWWHAMIDRNEGGTDFFRGLLGRSFRCQLIATDVEHLIFLWSVASTSI
jgi:hypothetical protein